MKWADGIKTSKWNKKHFEVHTMRPIPHDGEAQCTQEAYPTHGNPLLPHTHRCKWWNRQLGPISDRDITGQKDKQTDMTLREEHKLYQIQNYFPLYTQQYTQIYQCQFLQQQLTFLCACGAKNMDNGFTLRTINLLRAPGNPPFWKNYGEVAITQNSPSCEKRPQYWCCKEQLATRTVKRANDINSLCL